MAAVDNIAIIGAGLTGLTLCLSLHQQGIPCTVYEARSSPPNIGGTMNLSPNALRILDSLGVYESLKPGGVESELLYFRTQEGKPIDSIEYGGEQKYGYAALRVYRHALIAALLSKISGKNIEIKYNKRFVRVISETETQVTWEFDNGSIGQATTLVGADGIHSRVRKHIHPEVEPQFINTLAMFVPIPVDSQQFPTDLQLPVTLMSSTHNAIIVVYSKPDKSEIVMARQIRAEELDRQGWKDLFADKEWCTGVFREGVEDFPDYIRTAVSNISANKIFAWPFYIIPELDKWASEKGQVIILGDAAHAIPPSTGQGANQVFEDAFTYAMVLKKCSRNSLKEALPKWKSGRGERVNKLKKFAEHINARRLPQGNGLENRNDVNFDMGWLYKPDYKDMVNSWVDPGKHTQPVQL